MRYNVKWDMGITWICRQQYEMIWFGNWASPKSPCVRLIRTDHHVPRSFPVADSNGETTAPFLETFGHIASVPVGHIPTPWLVALSCLVVFSSIFGSCRPFCWFVSLYFIVLFAPKYIFLLILKFFNSLVLNLHFGA